MVGAPAYVWLDDIENEIFDRLAKGEAIRNICKDDWLPAWSTFNKRLSADAAFAAQYAQAKEEAANTIFDECLTIADQYEADEATAEGGTDHIQRARLRIDTRKWMAGKLRPRVYGEKLDLTHANPDGSNISFQTVIEQKPES